MKTPEKLPLGKYRIVEVEGPHGYFNDRQYNVVFELTSDRVYQVSGGSADGMDDYVITENYYNHETLGQIKIGKAVFIGGGCAQQSIGGGQQLAGNTVNVVCGEHYGGSDAHDCTTNSGRYYLREISVPDGYLIEQSVIPVEFTYENQFIAWQVVDCLHSDKQTTVEIDKRAFTSDSDDSFALTCATLTVTDWNGNVVDSWESSDTAHVICGLHLSHDFAGNRDTSKVYTLAETCPADGYTTARSIQFRLEQATDDNAYLQETAVWVLHESEDTAYQSGSIISPTAFSDDTVATISAKLRACQSPRWSACRSAGPLRFCPHRPHLHRGADRKSVV